MQFTGSAIKFCNCQDNDIVTHRWTFNIFGMTNSKDGYWYKNKTEECEYLKETQLYLSFAQYVR